MGRGVKPAEDHLGVPYATKDPARHAQGGERLNYRCACIFIKGDLMEHSSSLGFPAVSASIGSCCNCWVTPGEFLRLAGSSIAGIADQKVYTDFDAACAACEHSVVLDQRQLIQVRGSLVNDRRNDGSRGRTLSKDFPEFGLKIGDRLEPCAALPNIHAGVDSMVSGTLYFWRRSAETHTRHRCPIFNEDLGITPNSIVPCWLHALSLGTFKCAIAHVFWQLQLVNAWGVRQAGEEAMLETSVPIIQCQLFDWYRYEAAHNRQHSRVQRLTTGMFGSSKAPTLGLHGAETNGFLCFCASYLSRYFDKLADPVRCRRLLDTAVQQYQLIRENPITMSKRDSQASTVCVVSAGRGPKYFFKK